MATIKPHTSWLQLHKSAHWAWDARWEAEWLLLLAKNHPLPVADRVLAGMALMGAPMDVCGAVRAATPKHFWAPPEHVHNIWSAQHLAVLSDKDLAEHIAAGVRVDLIFDVVMRLLASPDPLVEQAANTMMECKANNIGFQNVMLNWAVGNPIKALPVCHHIRLGTLYTNNSDDVTRTILNMLMMDSGHEPLLRIWMRKAPAEAPHLSQRLLCMMHDMLGKFPSHRHAPAHTQEALRRIVANMEGVWNEMPAEHIKSTRIFLKTKGLPVPASWMAEAQRKTLEKAVGGEHVGSAAGPGRRM